MAAGILAFATAPLDAQFFTDFSAGAAFSQPTTVTVEDESSGLFFTASADTDIETSFTFDFRFGGWIQGVPWLGVAGDFSYFQAEDGVFDQNDIFPFSVLVLFRAPLLRTREIPGGQLQPYFGVGPGAFFSNATVDLRPAVPSRVSTTGVDAGIDARAGLAWQFHPNLALFWEYRFTYFRQELEEGDDFCCDFPDERSEADILTHHVLMGISFRFP